MKLLFYSLLVFIILDSCVKKETCPPDVVLGNLSLQTNSKDYLPYNFINYIEFVDSLADSTVILQNPGGLINDTSKTFIENICIIDKERSDKYYLSEHKTINFFDIDTSRKFRIIGNLTILEDYLSTSTTLADPVLYDELKLTVHRSNPSLSGAVATIEFVSNDRGNLSRMSDSLISKINKIKMVPVVKINDSTYTDVYEVRNNDSIYYYFKPLVGVVAFRDINSIWWNLHRKY